MFLVVDLTELIELEVEAETFEKPAETYGICHQSTKALFVW